MELHVWLRAWMERRGYNAHQLARRSHVDKGYLSHLLAGRKRSPSIWTVLRLVRALDLSAGELDSLTEPEGLRRRSGGPVE